MNSTWQAEIGAVFRKELKTELRTKSGLFSSGLFSIIAVIAVALAGYGERIDPTMGAGLFWVTLLFSAMISLPRAFVSEEEAGTGDQLRLLARPHAVFWGKALFNMLLMAATSVVLSVMFVVFTNLKVDHLLLFALSLAGGCVALAISVTLCGALVAQATNRSALAGVIGIPLLLPFVAMGVGALRVSLGSGSVNSGLISCGGLYAFALLMGAAAPNLYAAIWKG
ncbi:MAG TPA: heme exporter protein CcmB [Fimbriimonadaceae bacterium]